jgi:hypothetical protein
MLQLRAIVQVYCSLARSHELLAELVRGGDDSLVLRGTGSALVGGVAAHASDGQDHPPIKDRHQGISNKKYRAEPESNR